jgi:hypothetical protein
LSPDPLFPSVTSMQMKTENFLEKVAARHNVDMYIGSYLHTT